MLNMVCCCLSRDYSYKKSVNKLGNGSLGTLSGLNILSKNAVKDDIEEFDRAFRDNDVPSLLRLCNSTQNIGKIYKKLHPWAKSPRTLGSLAIMKIAMLAAQCEKINNGVRDKDVIEEDIALAKNFLDKIIDSSGIGILVRNLGSEEIDRSQCSLVALSFLSVQSSEVCREIHDYGAMSELVELMDSDNPGVRSASILIARNIYQLSLDYKKEFIELEGLDKLLRILKEPPKENGEVIILETLYYIQDLISDDDGLIIEISNSITPYAKELIFSYVNNEDSDIALAATELKNCLL